MLEEGKLERLMEKIPAGYSTGMYNHRKYGISKNLFNNSRSFKVFAEELGGNDCISFNFYLTGANAFLKPCEMPAEKVIDFLYHLQVLPAAVSFLNNSADSNNGQWIK